MAAKKKISKKKAESKKTKPAAVKKAVKKTAKKETKKAAVKKDSRSPGKTAGKATKKTAKKSVEKTTVKKAAKKTMTKKTAQKAAVKEAPEKTVVKKVPVKKVKKTGAKATKNSNSQKDIEKALAKSSGARVSVQIGGIKPALSIAPGVLLSKPVKKVEDKIDENKKIKKPTKRELEKIRVILHEKRDQLIHGMKRELADHRARVSSKAADEADKAADSYDEDLSFEITMTSERELQQIEKALEKIDDGTYGECESCGVNIRYSRLCFLPFAVDCKACTVEKERTGDRRSNENGLWGLAGDDEEE